MTFPANHGFRPSRWSPAEGRARKDRLRREESRTAGAGRIRPVLGKSFFHTLKRRRSAAVYYQCGCRRFSPPSCVDIACRRHKNDGFYTKALWLSRFYVAHYGRNILIVPKCFLAHYLRRIRRHPSPKARVGGPPAGGVYKNSGFALSPARPHLLWERFQTAFEPNFRTHIRWLIPEPFFTGFVWYGMVWCLKKWDIHGGAAHKNSRILLRPPRRLIP